MNRSSASDDARATVVRFTPRGRKLLSNIFAIVEEVEARFDAIAGVERMEAARATLNLLADAIDPDGAFGEKDEN